MIPEQKAYIQSWLDKAKHDLLSAQRLIEIEPLILDNACFHCQQAVEKYLKAFLIYSNRNIERTHDIIFLLSQCAEIESGFTSLDPMNINAYGVRGRYPDSNLLPELEEAKGYYQLAIDIKALVIAKIVFA